MEKQIRDWELVIRGEKYKEAKISYYPLRNNGKGEYTVDNGHLGFMKFYKTYKSCVKYLEKNGYTPIIKKGE